MLTREHAICEYRDGEAFPDRLNTHSHERYEALARDMLRIYKKGMGRRRCELHGDVDRLFYDVDDCPPRRIAAFCKLLDEAGRFDDKHIAASRLRMKVCDLAAASQPLIRNWQNGIVGCSEDEVKTAIAAQLRRPWNEIEEDFFADVIEFQRLRSFAGYESPRAFLSRYNVRRRRRPFTTPWKSASRLAPTGRQFCGRRGWRDCCIPSSGSRSPESPHTDLFSTAPHRS